MSKFSGKFCSQNTGRTSHLTLKPVEWTTCRQLDHVVMKTLYSSVCNLDDMNFRVQVFVIPSLSHKILLVPPEKASTYSLVKVTLIPFNWRTTSALDSGSRWMGWTYMTSGIVVMCGLGNCSLHDWLFWFLLTAAAHVFKTFILWLKLPFFTDLIRIQLKRLRAELIRFTSA